MSVDRLRLIHLAAIGFLLVLLFVVLPSWNPPTLRFDTLDGGYRAVVNEQSLRDLSYGTEIVTTVGPLGFLRNRDFWPDRYVQKISWDLLIAIAFAATSLRLIRGRSGLATVLFCLGLTLALALVRFDIFRVTVSLHVLYLMTRVSHRNWIDSLIAAVHIVALSVATWVLFTYLLLSVAVVILGEFLYFLRHRQLPMLGFLYVGSSLFWWLVTGQEISNLLAYFYSSLQVSSGYVEVMLRQGGFLQLAVPMVGALSLIAYGLFLWNPNGHWPALQRGITLVAIACITFILFRSAFVRFEVMRALEASVNIAVMSLFGAYSFSIDSRRPNRLAAAFIGAYVITIAGAATIMVESDKLRIASYIGESIRQPAKKISDIGKLIREPDRLQADFDRAKEQIRTRFPLSHIHGPVGMHGNLQGIMIANDLDFHPRPVFQTFDAYTPFLEDLNGRFIRSEAAPEHIIVEMQRALGYPEGLSDSDAWLAIFEGYEVDQLIDCKFRRRPHGLLVIKRKPEWVEFVKTQISEGTYLLGETIKIPQDVIGDPIWVEIDDQKTTIGRIGTTLLKLPVLKIEITLKNKKGMKFKFSPAPARGGFLLSPQIRSVGEMARLMESGLENAPGSRVVTDFCIREDPSMFSGRVRTSVKVKIYALRATTIS